MIEKYCNFKATAMKILVKSNQRNCNNCELLDCRVVGLGGLEPPTSPLSELCVILLNAFNLWVYIKFLYNFPDSSPIFDASYATNLLDINSFHSVDFKFFLIEVHSRIIEYIFSTLCFFALGISIKNLINSSKDMGIILATCS